MDLVKYHVILVIYRWCGLKPPSYGADSLLSDMWAGVSETDYLWTGANALKKEIVNDPFFQGCDTARNLDVKRFAGDIQTVSDLYFVLKPCGEVGVNLYAATSIFDNTVDSSDRG